MRVIKCTHCQGSLGVTEAMEGKKVRCPKCGHKFIAGERGGDAPPMAKIVEAVRETPPPVSQLATPPRAKRREEDRDEDFIDEVIDEVLVVRKGPGMTSNPAWRNVKAGLQILHRALATYVVAIFCFAVFGLVAALIFGDPVHVAGAAAKVQGGALRGDPDAPGGPPAGLAVGFLASICVLISMSALYVLSVIVGQILCIFTPDPPLRAHAIGILVCTLGNVVMGVVQIVVQISMPPEMPQGNRAFQGDMVVLLVVVAVNFLFWIVGWLFVLSFLRGVGRFFDNDRLVKSCAHFFRFNVWMVLVILFGGGGVSGVGPKLFMLAGMAFMLLMVALMDVFWYLRLLSEARDVIGRGLTQDSARPVDEREYRPREKRNVEPVEEGARQPVEEQTSDAWGTASTLESDEAQETVELVFAQKPRKGQSGYLELKAKALFLRDEAGMVLAVIEAPEAPSRVQLPSFWTSSFIAINDGHGAIFCFEPREQAVAHVRRLLAVCRQSEPSRSAAALRRKALRDLLIGSILLVAGIAVTAAKFQVAGPGGKFYVMTGLIVVGVVEILRGFYWLAKAR